MQFGLTIIGSVTIHTIYSYVIEQVVYSILEVTMQPFMKLFRWRKRCCNSSYKVLV